MNITGMEYSQEQPISFALGANLNERAKDLKARLDTAQDAEDVALPIAHTLISFAFQAVTALRSLEIEVQQLRAQMNS